MKKFLIIVGVAILLGVIAYLAFFYEKPIDAVGSSVKPFAGDVIGVRSGTSTTYVLALSVATTSYVSKIGGLASKATYSFEVGVASGTPALGWAYAYMNFLGSNDVACDTSTTTTIYDIPTKTQIHWYDIGQLLRPASTTFSLYGATTTYAWNGIATGTTKTLTLTDLNFECLKLDITIASATLYTQLRVK